MSENGLNQPNLKSSAKEENKLISPKKNKKSLNGKSKLSPDYVANSNKAIFFKIIHDEVEFENFNAPLGEDNFDNTFQPTYTNNPFGEKQQIIGYKGLKIKISLTPVTLYPYINIQYEDTLSIKDDIIFLLKEFYTKIFEESQDYYESEKIDLEEILQLSKERFLSELKNEVLDVRHTVINVKEDNSSGNRLKIIQLEVLADKFLKGNLHLQCFLTFFIDGGSPIPLDLGYWNYFLLFEENINTNKLSLIGYCTAHHFHLEYNRYRSLTSQFLIIPSFHRKGYGFHLLEGIYEYYRNLDDCLQISTEDPAKEFEYLRDIVIFKKTVEGGYFDEILKVKITKKEDYKQLSLESSEINRISQNLKISRAIVQTSLDVLKFILISRKELSSILSPLMKELRTDIKVKFYKASRVDYEGDYDFNKRKIKKGRNPFIYLHDEEEQINLDTIEIPQMTDSEINEMLENNCTTFLNDIKKVSTKCESILLTFMNTKV